MATRYITHDHGHRPARLPRETARLHPLVWRSMVAAASLLALGILGFAGGGADYNGLVIAVAVLFVLVAVGLPLVMGHILQRREAARGQPGRLRDWLAGEVDVWQGHLKGWDAAAAILLPLGAVSVGMVIFAVVLRLVAG